jgi:hypothetical protein
MIAAVKRGLESSWIRPEDERALIGRIQSKA